jgi:hypothetical protein
MDRIWAYEHQDAIAPFVWDALRSINDQRNIGRAVYARVTGWWFDFKTNVGEASRSEGHTPAQGQVLPPFPFTIAREGDILTVTALGQTRHINMDPLASDHG